VSSGVSETDIYCYVRIQKAVLATMSSSKAKEAVKQIVGRLTKTEVLGCLPIGWVRWKDGRTWTALKDVVQGLSKDLKARIFEAACTKDRLLKRGHSISLTDGIK
jgi:hypothetical protein